MIDIIKMKKSKKSTNNGQQNKSSILNIEELKSFKKDQINKQQIKFKYICSACKKPITRDKFLLNACDKFWHENCLKCDRCQGKLAELGSTLYCKSNMLLCKQDYLDLFGKTGVCSICEKLIQASEMAMRARENVYHLECFACQLCNQRFCVGDRFYLCENKVVCQYDYEEHILPIQRSLILEQSLLKQPQSEASNNLYKNHETKGSSGLIKPEVSSVSISRDANERKDLIELGFCSIRQGNNNNEQLMEANEGLHQHNSSDEYGGGAAEENADDDDQHVDEDDNDGDNEECDDVDKADSGDDDDDDDGGGGGGGDIISLNSNVAQLSKASG